ncbi:hypothetical protein D5S17_26565 [Pseudonocardiaceae bacterium YIM PH 21723]|nr:hypothetical protein D5S17_26565 [Pseudonocardiaceae bacterium YIM PH 21723]
MWLRVAGRASLLVLAACCALTALTVLTLAGRWGSVTQTGTATLTGCQRSGPITEHGWGTMVSCQAEVKADTSGDPPDAGASGFAEIWLPARYQRPVITVQALRFLPGSTPVLVPAEQPRHPVLGLLGAFFYLLLLLVCLLGALRRTRPRAVADRELRPAAPARWSLPPIIAGVLVCLLPAIAWFAEGIGDAAHGQWPLLWAAIALCLATPAIGLGLPLPGGTGPGCLWVATPLLALPALGLLALAVAGLGGPPGALGLLTAAGLLSLVYLLACLISLFRGHGEFDAMGPSR